MGRVLTHTLPMNQTESFVYDLAGNVQKHTDFASHTTTFVYDANNRVTQKQYADGSEETYTYTPTGQIETASQRRGAACCALTSYTYDAIDSLATETKPTGEQLAYTYDANGNRTSVTVTTGNTSTQTSYTFDALNRLASATDANGTTQYSYDAVGNRSAVIYPNAFAQLYSYDALNRLTTLTTDHNGTTTERYSYTLDATGNRTYQTVNGVSTAYSYDANDQLQSAGGITYSYDANGNTLTEVDSVANTQKSFTYNAKNELIAANDGATQTTFDYDIDGIRNEKSAGGITTRFITDKNRDYAQVLLELENNNPVASYTYGDDLISQQAANDDVQGCTNAADAGCVGAATSFYLYDGLGSTRALSNAAGAITDTYEYAAFGEALNSTGTTPNNYKYTGEQFDESLDQYYLRSRYYNQNTGRLTQRDTWEGNSQDPVTLHKYLYANVDPVSYTDPTGHFGLNDLMLSVRIVGINSTRAVGNVATRSSKAILNLARSVSIRIQYMKRVRALRAVEDQLMKSGKSTEEIAKILNAERRNIGKIFKDLTDPVTRKNALERNIIEYGDEYGPTWQYLRSQGKSWEEIIESASRPNSDIMELAKIFFR